eukprot:1139874-Pelagomonas_calceolata.AAC.1
MALTASAHFINSESKSCIQRRHRHHVQGDVSKKISNLARTSQGHNFLYKVKSHAGRTGNECADKIAQYQASLKDNNLTGTGIHSVGPGGKPFYDIAWLAREEARPTTPGLFSEDGRLPHLHWRLAIRYTFQT